MTSFPHQGTDHDGKDGDAADRHDKRGRGIPFKETQCRGKPRLNIDQDNRVLI